MKEEYIYIFYNFITNFVLLLLFISSEAAKGPMGHRSPSIVLKTYLKADKL
jgi:hypothetical protein